MRLDYCKLHTMTGEYGLSARASFQFPCSVSYFVPPCLWYSSCHLSTLALCFRSPHLTILSLLSLIKDVLSHLISRSCCFLFPHIITHSLLFLLQHFHSHLWVNLCLSFTSTNQDPHLYSFGHSSLYLSCESQLPFLLPQSTIPVPIYPLQVLLMSLWI